MWMGLIQLVGGVKRKGQGFLEKEFSHKTNMILSCEFLACWPAFTSLGCWCDRDAQETTKARKGKASSQPWPRSPIKVNDSPNLYHFSMKPLFSPLLHPLPQTNFPRQPGREKGPVKEVPGTKASP
uniref:Uncharacterized protein n=1 Tax=Rhinopithecus roxellana TaxID=61622 RepID=A0A2K6QRT9_RHIRO